MKGYSLDGTDPLGRIQLHPPLSHGGVQLTRIGFSPMRVWRYRESWAWVCRLACPAPARTAWGLESQAVALEMALLHLQGWHIWDDGQRCYVPRRPLTGSPTWPPGLRVSELVKYGYVSPSALLRAYGRPVDQIRTGGLSEGGLSHAPEA